MSLLLQSLRNLNGISFISLEDENLLIAWDKHSNEMISSINLKTYSFQINTVSDNYDDLLRILAWFKLKNSNSKNNNSDGCSALGCEDCKGCQYSYLTKLYNAKKVLGKYLPQDIIDSCVFIGTAQVKDLIHYTTTLKKYIYLSDCKLHISSFDYILQPPSWKSKSLEEFNFGYYIDEFIPEVLAIPNFIKQVYGIYKGEAGIWKLELLNTRFSWIFEKLDEL